jgi:hypothetical protein
VGVEEKEHDLTTKQFANFIICNLLAGSATITDITNTGRSVAANTACTAPTIQAGTTGTAAAFTDYALGAETETVSATIGSISSNTFTVTGTITATASRAYQEVGLVVTCSSHTFLITHDTFSTLNVSNGGTLAVTYTFTFT